MDNFSNISFEKEIDGLFTVKISPGDEGNTIDLEFGGINFVIDCPVIYTLCFLMNKKNLDYGSKRC